MHSIANSGRRLYAASFALVALATATPTVLHADCYRVYTTTVITTWGSDGQIISQTITTVYEYSYCDGGDIAGSK